jgi:hypothetical protein
MNFLTFGDSAAIHVPAMPGSVKGEGGDRAPSGFT